MNSPFWVDSNLEINYNSYCFSLDFKYICSYNFNQARSQNFVKGGGLFWKVETTNFHCSRIRLRRSFRPKTGDLKKKKVFTKIETDFSTEITNSNGFSDRITKLLHNFGFQIPLVGAVFILEQKSASKVLKTCDVAYFSGQCGGDISPPPPWLRCRL